MLPILLTIATLVAVGLMLVVLVRMGKRYDALQADFDRLKVVQRDMSTDVRTRLDEGTKTWEAVESEVKPRLTELEALEPSVADLASALEENLPALAEARRRLEAVEEKSAGTEARVSAALEASATEAGERLERIEDAVRTLRNAADERLAELAGRVTALEEAATAPLHAADGETPPAFAVPAGVGAAEDDDETAVPPPIPGSSRRGSRGTSGSGAGRWVLIAVLVAIGVVAIVAAAS